MSRLPPADTARTCSLIEAKFALVVTVSGGGHCRLTDVGRSKVVGPDRYTCECTFSAIIIVVDCFCRSFIINESCVGFGYAAGFKAAGQSSANRRKGQLLALKQLGTFGSRLLNSYLIMGKPMAVMAAHALGLGPEPCEAHGTYLVARNGANVLVGANENWFRSVTNNALKLYVGCTTKYFRQAYEVKSCLYICYQH